MARAFPQFEEVDDATVEILKRKTPQERLTMAFRMWDFARDLLSGIVRQENPGWGIDQIRHEVARRMSHGAV
jgi:hypothetical protein